MVARGHGVLQQAITQLAIKRAVDGITGIILTMAIAVVGAAVILAR